MSFLANRIDNQNNNQKAAGSVYHKVHAADVPDYGAISKEEKLLKNQKETKNRN